MIKKLYSTEANKAPNFAAMALTPSKKIIFFDGYCALCNASVNWIIKRDKFHQYRYAAIQGKFARKNLSAIDTIDHPKTILYWSGKKLLSQSTAALHIAKELPYPWKLLYFFIVIPPQVRDAVYNYISTHRYQWFGKYDSCRVPKPNEKNLFLP